MGDGIGGTRTILISLSYVFSGLTSFVVLIAAKRFLDAEEFGVFAIFWSLGFFAAAVSSAPVEQELARSIAVQVDCGRITSPEILAGVRAMVVGSAVVLALSALAAGFMTTEVDFGVFLALSALVAGEAVAALVRGEAAARRDTAGLVTEVAGHGFVRAVAALAAAAATGNLVLVCFGVALGGAVPVALVPRLLRRSSVTSTRHGAFSDPGHVSEASRGREARTNHEFSVKGVRRLALATPPRALFAIGTPVLAAFVADNDETAVVGGVLAALSITSAPVLVAAALQATLIPQFATWEARGDRAAAHARLVVIISLVLVGTAVASAFTFIVGRPLLEMVFGETPGVGRSALVAMTAGAGLLFLSNMLLPAAIATHRYTAMTAAWTAGAAVLCVAAFGPGAVADSIGRAVLVGASIVNVVLLWALWPLLRPVERPARRKSSGLHGDIAG